MAIEPRIPARNTMIINFPEQILSVDASSVGGGTITQSGTSVVTAANNGQSYIFYCEIVQGYRISNVEYNSDSATLTDYTDNSFTIIAGMGGIDGTATISVAQIGPKAVSLDNLQKFKEKCDETYAKKTDIPEEYTLPVANASTLGGVKPVAKTSEMTQNVGVDSNGALYTKPAPDIPDIPEPTSADAGKVPTVNSAGNGYELQMPSGGGAQLYKHSFDCSVGTSGYSCRLDVISVVSTAMTDDEFITELKAGRIISSFLYMSFDPGGPGGLAEWYIQCILNYYGSNLYASYAQQSTFLTDQVVINSEQSTVVAL